MKQVPYLRTHWCRRFLQITSITLTVLIKVYSILSIESSRSYVYCHLFSITRVVRSNVSSNGCCGLKFERTRANTSISCEHIVQMFVQTLFPMVLGIRGRRVTFVQCWFKWIHLCVLVDWRNIYYVLTLFTTRLCCLIVSSFSAYSSSSSSWACWFMCHCNYYCSLCQANLIHVWPALDLIYYVVLHIAKYWLKKIFLDRPLTSQALHLTTLSPFSLLPFSMLMPKTYNSPIVNPLLFGWISLETSLWFSWIMKGSCYPDFVYLMQKQKQFVIVLIVVARYVFLSFRRHIYYVT